MRIAISTDGLNVASHFGRCPEYTIVDIEDASVVKKERIPNPGHAPGVLPAFLSERGVEFIIAGGMGPRAQGFFAQYKIETIIGAAGPVDKVIEDFVKGELTVGESQCDHDSPSHKKCKD